tara:strand:+ start:66 stop:521 length:456 start_codon:yes stop_codon:yes gene_type:complete
MKDYFSYSTSDDWDQEKEERPYREHVFNHFALMAGLDLEYFGADESSNEFKIDGIIFKVLEDPNDGYRSMLGVIEYGKQSDSIFFRQPVGKVRIESYEGESRDSYNSGCQGYRLVDIEDGHVWLEFGTDNTDDYYPYFIFRHMPKEPKVEV